MNILLIDDQPNIISSLVAGIPWHDMGFASIFTATGAARAREIISTHEVDIVVSDIEMPGEDGLSLLAWARKNGYDYECILLTAHADFFYAQQAISLRVSEYVIQPAKNEDIIHAVKNAMLNLEAKDRQRARLRTDNFNYAAQNIVIRSMFEDWPLVEASIINPELLDRRISQLAQFDIDCTPDTSCLVYMIHTRRWTRLPLSASDFLTRYENICREIFSPDTGRGLSWYSNESTFFTVFVTENRPEITDGLKALYRRIPKEIGTSVRLSYAFTELRCIKNVLDDIREIEKQYGLSHSSDDIQLVEISKEDLYHAAQGSENYAHYARLIREYITKNISEPLTRSDIAAYLRIPPDQVSYVIKITEDLSVKEMITKIKMEQARRMLRNTKNTIGEIAGKCGYDSFAYFSKVYRDTYGVTPSQDREQQ